MDKLDWFLLISIPVVLIVAYYTVGYYHELYMEGL